MHISGVSTPTVHDYSTQVLHTQEMNQISASIGQINDAHERRKEETDEINKQALS